MKSTALSAVWDSPGLWGMWKEVAGGVWHALCLPLTSLAFFSLDLYENGLRELDLTGLVLCLNIGIPL